MEECALSGRDEAALEREIALLAKERLSTREMAASLVISPAAVKNTLNKTTAS